MSSGRYERAAELFLQARSLPSEDRPVFLEEACANDNELRAEVESLLANDDDNPLVEEPEPSVAPSGRAVPTPSSGSSGSLATSWTRLSASRWRGVVLVSACAFLVALLGWWTHGNLSRSLRDIRTAELDTTLDAAIRTVEVWIEAELNLVGMFAEDPRVRVIAEQLVEIARDGDEAVEELRATPLQQELLELLAPAFSLPDSRGGNMQTPEGFGFWVSVPSEIGFRLNARGFANLDRILSGERVFNPPFRSAERVRVGDFLSQQYTVARSPVYDESGEIIASLSFASRWDGPFSQLLRATHVGDTGETYAFGADARMLSESRFGDQLREEGFLPAESDEVSDWQRSSILNIEVREPVPAAPSGDAPDSRRGELTRIAAEAIESADSRAGNRGGVILEPYVNYRGREVIGAWRWVEAHGFAVATEIEVDEAFAPVRYLEAMLAVVFSALMVSLAVSIASAVLSARSARSLPAGSKVGNYTLIEEIGRGGMARVYRAEHALLKRPTAVKILSPEVADDEMATRFEREVQATAALTHPNTVDIYDYGTEDDGTFYYAMEFIDGVTLAELLKIERSISPARAVHVLRQVCGSLAEAHAAGLIHRDVKPLNVMLCRRGLEDDVVKVLDFGLVKRVFGEETRDITTRHRVTGTLLYMAPERVRDPFGVDARADIYSIGALAYLMLSGREIFDAKTDADLLVRIMNDAPKAVSEMTDDRLPEPLAELVMRCLAKDPGDRPATVLALAADLAAIPLSDSWTEGQATDWWRLRRSD